MTQPSLPTRNSGLRVFSASLLSALLIVMPFVQLAAASGRSSAVASRVPEKKQQAESKGQQSAAAVEKVFLNAPIPKPAPEPVAPLAPVIVATKTDNVLLTSTVNPGDTISYTVNIANNGAASPADDATGVQFSDTIDAHTTLVPGSPVAAVSDKYNAIGNTQISVPDGSTDLLGNDFDPDTGNNVGMTVTAYGATTGTEQTVMGTATPTAQGGSVTANANGSFTYDPPLGFEGTDTFKYRADSGGFTAITTVRITIAGMIWFINNNAGACTSSCDGRLSHPFQTLAAFQAVNNGTGSNPAAGDSIFLYESSPANDYVGPVTLLANQKFIGQDATASLATITGLTAPSGTDPFPVMAPANGAIVNITATGGNNGINLGSGNTLRGFTVGNTATGTKISGTSFGTLIVGNSASPDVTLNGTGQALNLTTGVLSVAGGFVSVASTSSAAQGINLAGVTDDGVGPFSFGSTTVSGSTTQGILVGTTTADINFGNTSVGTGTAGSGGTDAVSLQNNSSGTRTFGTLTIQNSTGNGFRHALGGGAVNVTSATTITNPGTIGINVDASTTLVSFGNANVTQSGGAGVSFTNNTNVNGDLTFADLDIAPDANVSALVANNNTGTLTSTTGDITTTDANAINSTSSVLALALNSVTAANSGSAASGISLTSTTGTLSSSAGTITGGTAPAVLVSGGSVQVTYGGGITQADNAAAVSVTGGNTSAINFNGNVSATNGTGLQFSNADGTYNFNATTTLNGAGVADTGVDILLDSAGTFTFVAATTITSPTGIAFNVDGGVSTSTCNVTYSGNITQANNFAMVNVTNHNTGTITFQTGTLSATNGTGLQFNNADSTTSYNFNGTTTLNGGDAGIDITNGSNGTFSFGGTTITNPTGVALNVDNSTGGISISGAISKNTDGRIIDFNLYDTGTANISGSISCTAACDGIEVINNDAGSGTVNISNATKTLTTNGTLAAVNLTNNDGGAVNFTGGTLVINTTGGIGFNAINGGTVTVVGAGNTINATTGPANTNTANALTVSGGTTIGAGGMTFQSISSGNNTAAADPAKGIIVNGAGSGFTVTGTSTTDGTGGTIQNTTSNGIEIISTNSISLTNMNLTNNGTAQTVAGSSGSCGGDLRTGNNLSCVANLFLQTNTTVSLTNLNVIGGDQMGINGNNVTTFTLSNSDVTGNGTEAFENGVTFQNLFGTSSITNTIIKNNAARQVHIGNTTNSSTLTLGITGTRTNNAYPTQDTSTTMIGNDAPNGANTQQGILFETNTTGTSISMTLNINGVVFNNNQPQNAVDIQPIAASTTFGGTTQNSSFDTNSGGVIISGQNASNGTYNILNNEFNRTSLQSILYAAANPTSGTIQGTVQGNTIGTSGQAASACVTPAGVAGLSNCTGIDVNFIGGTGAIRLKIGGAGAGEGNTVQQFDGNGIRIVANGSGNPKMHATIQNNTVQQPAGVNVANGIDTNIGTTAGANVEGCFTITGNTITGTYEDPGVGQLALHTRVRFLSEHRLPGMAGTGAANAETFLNTNNPGVGGLARIFSEGAGVPGYQSGAACTTPLLFAEGGIESALASNSFLTSFAFPSLRNLAAPIAPCSAAQPALENATTTSSSLTQPQLETIVSAAMERWASTGLNETQTIAMRELRFEVGDLGDGYLGEASGKRIVVDRDAQGKGWFVDSTPADDLEFTSKSSATRRYTNPFTSAAGRIDLLTAIEHEIGHKLGLDDSYLETDRDSIMYGYLTVGERRIPATGQAAKAQAGSLAKPHFLKLKEREDIAQKSEARRNHAAPSTRALSPASGETVTATIGTLPAGGSVTITFQVTVNNPPNLTLLTPNPRVENQGLVTATGGISVNTDDPETGTAGDKTATRINLFDTTTSLVSNLNPSNVGDNVTFTATINETPVQGTANPAGTVDFIDTSNGNAVICDDVVVSSSQAQCSTTTLTAGTHNIRADYSGDGNFDPSQSNIVAQVVNACTSNPIVTSTADSGAGTLREAIANVCNGTTITFNLAGAGPHTITLTTGELAVAKDVTINNNSGESITVSGNVAGRVFNINSGKTAAIIGLTMTGGNSAQNGGGILNEGALTVVNSTLTGNLTAIDGGAISNSATATSLTLINTTVSANDANGFGGGVDVLGGTVTIINSTITGNRSDFDDNAAGGAGGVRRQAGTVTLHNTIVAGNFKGAVTPVANDIEGTVEAASSNNLIGDAATAGGLTNGVNGNIVGNAGVGTIVLNTVIGALANNGGLTNTHALVATGPAVEAGNNANLPVDTFDLDGDANMAETLPVDQRGTGFPRTADSADANATQTVDIGAFELHPSVEDITDKTTAEDTAVPQITFNLGDGTGALIASVTATSGNTTLVPNANILVGGSGSTRTLDITPAPNANSPADGTATITVTVTATNGRTAVDTFVVTVTEVNDAPVPTNDTIPDIGEDCTSGCTAGKYVIPFATLLANDTNKGAPNESGQTLTITAVSAPTGGTVAINGTDVEFTPTADFSGPAGFTYTVTDNGTTNGVNDFKTGNATVSFNITNVNDDPTLATNTGITVNEASTGNIITSAMLSVTDPDNTASQIVFTVGTAPANGTLRKSGGALAGGSTFTQADINGNLITYDHNGSETTTDSFTFTVSDGAGGSIALTSFNITITPVNDAPVVTTTVANLSYTENDLATAIDTGVTITDADSANLVGATVSITTNFQSGQDVLGWIDNNVGDSITLSGTSTAQTIVLTGTDTLANYQAAVRAVTYLNTSDNPSTVTRTVTFTANDGTDTGSGTRGITVAATNDDPAIANNTGITVTEGSTGNIITSAMLSVTDPDNPAAQLTYTVGTAPANGTLRKSGGALAGGGTFTQADIDGSLITYDHDGSNTTTDSFTFTVSDGAGGSIGLTTFNITITPANDAPAITAGGTLNYTENDAATAIDTTITVSDGDSPNLASATVQITGNYVNGEDVLSFTDTATITGVFTAASGTLTLTGADTPANYQAALRSVRYNNTSENPSTLARTVSWTVNDGSSPSNIATSTINVAAVNDAPVNTVPGPQGTASNTPLTFSIGNGNQISVADADAGTSVIQVTLTATNGTLTLSGTAGLNFACGGCAGDGTADATMTFQGTIADINTALNGLTFTPNIGFSGPATLTIVSNDLGNTGSGGAQSDTDVVNIQVATEIRINDASSIEPASPNTIDMVFTVSLNSPAPAGGVSVNFSTQDEPAGLGKAVAGTCGNPGADYVATNGTVTFSVGQQVKTINVPICSDAVSEPDETFKVLLFGESGGTLMDGDATGTIKSANTAGTVLISELRTSGPGGAGDDFVEIYNNTNSPLTVAASDASAGYGLYKMGADCNATPVLIGVIPNGTVIPARGHYLFVGSAYSLADYGGTGAAAGNLTLSADIETDANVGLFSTSNIAGISSVNRLDAVGFGLNTGGACNLLREGSTLPPIAANATLQHSYFRKMCDWIQNQGCTVNGIPKDTNDNSVDFWLADTAGSAITGRLGAPGPENLASPIRRDNANNPGSGGIDVFLLDGTVGSAAAPNRTRTGVDPPSTFGTMTLRYRVVNNTGGNVTRLRYRIVDISTAIQPAGPVADLRVLSSSIEPGIGPVNDSVTCTAGGAGAPPCTVTVTATTLETPPAQPIGGGYNSTVSSGTITTGTPLTTSGTTQSILINFKLGVEKTGTFRFYLIVEALP